MQLFVPAKRIKFVFVLLLLTTLRPSQTLADVVTITTPSPKYTAGQAFDFTIEMPDVTGLFAYEISLLLTSDSGVAGIDYYFLDGISAPSNYVFPSLANRAVVTAIDSPSLSRLTISDIDDINFGTDVVSGTNDHVAGLQIMTAANFAGDLELSVDANGLFLDDINLSPVAEYNSIVSDILASGATQISPAETVAVPEPSATVIAFLGCVVAMLKGRRRREEARLIQPPA